MELLLIGIFGVTLGAALAAGRSFERRRDPVRARLQGLVSRSRVSMAPDAAPGRPVGPSPCPSLAPSPRGLRGRPRGLQLELLRAGLKLRPVEYRFATAAAVGVLGALGFFAPNGPVAAVVLAIVGALLPGVALKQMQAARVRKFENQMADALTLIASSLRSGYSFLRAIQVVGQEMPDPIAGEFRRVVAESSLGVPAEQALAHMVERVPSYDLELVVTAVNIQLQVGGNLAQILDTIADTIRERVRNQREIAALTAEGKLSGIVCALLPPVMAGILSILNPTYLKPLFTEPRGLFMIGGALVLQVLGALWTRALVRIDV